MRHRVPSLLFAIIVVPASSANAENLADACRQAIFSGVEAVSMGRADHLPRCLKGGKYDESCVATDFHTAVHENELRNRVAGAASPCRAALEAGAAVGDFAPVTCTNEWADCDSEVPVVASLDDLAECLVCQQRGYDFLIRSTLGMPRPAPDDIDERRCTRRIAKLTANTVRKSLFDAGACSRGASPPFDCPVDTGGDSRFGRALATFPRSVAACGIDEGRAPGALASLCGGTATDATGLADCFSSIAVCLACRTDNVVLGQGEDCAGLSGFAGCDGIFE